MKMQPQEKKIIQTYNQVAESYAAQRHDELSKKTFDPLLLKAFATANKHKGPFADFGCGPGQTTRFLYDNDIKDITGIDISQAMIEEARKLHPKIKFETGDLLNISYDSNHFGSAVAFYAIVHFTYEEIGKAFSEVNRVLKTGAHFLCSFHVGDETVHYDTAHDIPVDIDLYYFQTERIITLLQQTGFEIIEALERYPNKEEYQSKRGYIWAEKK
ncbi:methyltransferase domain-containing protein [Chitinophaga sp. SYP-B3965]|uniref:class I SAM-dependent methyltransferase n=1 Tax=Chitinophaga sp. SYP-B3965 TaxID=2663120 RepID=UPI00129A057A|nr:class I SAM-dependent methyltransferase [Chitinophaga sp. SYP-B3965]MRG46884.1 methyltransferase domain-containing protein [Chitinophaga sp. SYP-B3965]